MAFVFVNRDVFQQGTALKPAQYQPLVRQVCAFCTSCSSVAWSLFYVLPKKSRTGLSFCMFHLNFKICLLSTNLSAQRDYLDSFTVGSENVYNANNTAKSEREYRTRKSTLRQRPDYSLSSIFPRDFRVLKLNL